MTRKIEEIHLVPEKTGKILNKKQLLDYETRREDLCKWLLNLGKNPKQAQGYSRHTVKPTMYHIDRFQRFIWTELEDGYTTDVTYVHAELLAQLDSIG